MKSKWKYQTFIENEFPEIYTLRMGNKALIKIRANPFKGIVEINITSPKKEHYQSVISNGVVIDERDMKLNKSKYLEDFFEKYNVEISSLPNNRILHLIGNNYGILADFLNESKTKAYLEKSKTLLQKMLSIPERIARSLKQCFKSVFSQPSLSDIAEIALITCAGLGMYLHNFDYLFSGIFTSILSVFSGSFDWLVRGKNPHAIKILVTFGLGLAGIYTGFLYQ